MSPPALSVVIPNYNHAQFLPRSLEAMLRQSVQPTEILVLDDDSSDNSVEVVQAFARKHPVVRLHRNQRNLGVVANINHGVQLAQGDYVFFAAADDEIVPGFFEKSLNLLAQHPEAALCCTIGDYREESGLNWQMGTGVADRPSYLSPDQMVGAERRGRFYIPPHSVIFKKSALLAAGGFRPEFKYACDWFAMYVAGFRHGICFVPEPLAVFHVSSTSYYQRTRRDKAGHRQVIRALLDGLSQPEHRAPAEMIRRAGSLHLYGWPALRQVLLASEHRRFLTARFAFRAVKHSAQIVVKRFLPAPVGNWYLRLAGYQSQSSSPGPNQTEDTHTARGKRPA